MRIAILFLIVVSLTLSESVPAQDEPLMQPAGQPNGAEPVAKELAKPRITISKGTTFLLGPVDDEGYLDALEAVNQRASKGVTPESNAAVLLQEAFGPGEIDANVRKQFFRRLGVSAPPEKGDYLVDFGAFVEALKLPQQDVDALDDAQERAQSQPWRATDHPQIAQWLSVNSKPLAKVSQAARRPRMYTPLVAPEDAEGPKMINALLPTLGLIRNASRVLTTRAMLHLGEGRIEAAMQDLLDCHRLARLAGQGPTLIDGLVGIAIDGTAQQGDVALAQAVGATSRQLLDYNAKLAKLPPLPAMVDKIDFAERMMFVDAVISMARNEGDLLGDQTLAAVAEQIRKLGGGIDWNVTLRVGQGWYDKIVAAGKQPTYAQRQQAFNKSDEALKQMAAKAKNPAQALILPFLDPNARGQLVGQRIGEILVALLLPAVQATTVAEARGQMTFELGQLALALGAYRVDNGSYPKTLDALAPKYIAKIPQDRFTGKPLVYRPEKNGYLLYSLGPNQEDDGGVDQDAAGRAGSYQEFDIAVRVPRVAEGEVKEK
jgi:hypothetical protein